MREHVREQRELCRGLYVDVDGQKVRIVRVHRAKTFTRICTENGDSWVVLPGERVRVWAKED